LFLDEMEQVVPWSGLQSLLAVVLFIRLRKRKRIFWRDLHAVTGVWISAFVLFLLLTGLPWAKSWGGYLKKARSLSGRLPYGRTGLQAALPKLPSEWR
jgi:uncharacterized iron-regulated membrane protein